MYTAVRLAGVAVAASLLLVVSPASAIVISSGEITPGFSKDNQNPDGTSSLDAGITLQLSFEKHDDTSGTWSANIENSGDGVVTQFGLSLNGDFNWSETGFTFTPDTGNGCLSVTNPDKPCSWTSSGATQLTPDFLTNITLGASAGNPNAHKGIEEDEIVTLEWDVTGDFSTITASTLFDNLIAPNEVDGVIIDFDSFWAAHVQVLAGGESDKIGGNNPVDVAEPAMFGLFGIGLIGLGVAARRRRKTD